MSNLINTRLSNSTTVQANGIVPLGSVIHKSGCNINANGSSISIRGNGYYKITAVLTVEPVAVADMTATLNNNGVQIAEATATPAVANDAVNLTLVAIVYNKCGCTTDSVNVSINSAGSVAEMDIVVERV